MYYPLEETTGYLIGNGPACSDSEQNVISLSPLYPCWSHIRIPVHRACLNQDTMPWLADVTFWQS